MNRSLFTFFLVGLCCVALLITGCPKKAPKPEPQPPATSAVTNPEKGTGEKEMPKDQMARIKMQQAIDALSKDDVYFDYDKSDLLDAAKATLAKKAQFLTANPDIRVTIEGSCDERGSNEYNLGLGERRAASAKQYLVSLGVKQANLDTVTYGEEKPVCFEHNETCWSKNRRDHFVVNE
jgi:peptidoglycan-associated lipoprotein